MSGKQLTLYSFHSAAAVTLALQDRNECKDAGKPCSENAFCRNLQGGYRCTCKPGFAGDGRQCLQGLASTQKQQANKIAIIAGFGSVGLLSIIAITAVLAWICHKKTKKTEHETLMLTSFEPGFDVGYAEDIPEEHWQEYNNYESDYETADESDDSDVSLW
ncbi:Nidogen-1 [Exaiptasia diaphana]|nr:Nidogen-1 [Exaiptasia diaphana]